MPIYLPLAEMSANILVLLGMGAAVGFISGLFGVGGGFLITPLMIFTGVPPPIAVGTSIAQIVASSISGAIAQYKRNNVDTQLGLVLLLGGFLGLFLGVDVVRILRELGQFDVFISLCYVIFLGIIGSLMLIESVRSLLSSPIETSSVVHKVQEQIWLSQLPLKMRFNRSKLYISALPPFIIGAFVGFLAAIMGVGGGFILVPALIYLLRVPTNIVVGTSLFQSVFLASGATVLHAGTIATVDIVLATILMIGGVVGAQFGASAGSQLKGEQLRFLLAAIVLLVCMRLGWDLLVPPNELYSLTAERGPL
ncbi:MAG: sulfite exporter TauE/SafE family protein [Hyphomicrobium sp.]